MRAKFLFALVVLLVGWSLYIAVYRWWQVKHEKPANQQVMQLKISGLAAGTDVPRPVDEWPPMRAAWLVYQRFREHHPDIRLVDRDVLNLQGPAQESAVLMAMAGRTAGEIIASNCRVIDNWIAQDFLYPLDEYVLALVRENLANPEFVKTLAVHQRPPETLDIQRITLAQLEPSWLGIDSDVWEVIYRPGRDGVMHVWSWPNQVRTLALYYNRLLFAQQADGLRAAGLDPSRAPRTWEEMIQYCVVLSDAKTGNYGLILDVWGLDQSQGRGISHLTDLLWQAGAQIIQRTPDGGWQFCWDQSDGTIDAMRFLRELLFRRVRDGDRESPIARTKTANLWAASEEFGSLSAAPAMCWAYSSSTMAVQAFGNPEVLGIAPLPAGPVVLRGAAPALKPNESITWTEQKQRAAEGAGNPVLSAEIQRIEQQYTDPNRAGWFILPGHRIGRWDSLVNFGDGWRIRVAQLDADMFGITRLAESQIARDAAWKYIHFLSTREAERVRTDLMVETGNSMFVAPNLLTEFGYEDLLDNMPRSWREAIPIIRDSGRPAPNGANSQHLHRVLSRMADSTLVLTPPAQASALAGDPEVQRSWRVTTAIEPHAALDGAASPAKKTDIGSAATSATVNDSDAIRAWSRESVDYANRRLLNRLPPEQLSRAHGYAVVAVTIVAISFPIALWLFVRNSKKTVAATPFDFPRQSPRVHLQAWGFMIFAVVTILLWQYFPLARGAAMAFQDYRIMDSANNRTTWVGLDNFARVFTEPTTRKAAINTIIFVILSLAAGFFTPIFLAIMLDELPRGSLFFRMIYYLPAAMGGLVVAYLWAWFYSPQPTGLLNVATAPLIRATNELSAWSRDHSILLTIAAIVFPLGVAILIFSTRPGRSRKAGRRIGIGLLLLGVVGIVGLCVTQISPIATPIDWLNSSALLAMVCVIVPGVWAGVGPGCIIYLAALKSIPDEVYEAADLDGASPWRKVFSVTIPHLWPLVIINFIGAFIGAFRSWENIFVMTGGGPKDGTLVIGMEIWYNAFAYLRFGYATALAWILGTLLIGFAVFQLRVLRNARFATAGRA